ncbi:HAD-IB family phosphatase [Qipengyuania vesicularis]|uniref:HAD-IB family phosphatase n=1 Tax=Qipengyuania vesicularis TaxID=2867232 RepID=UPI001C876D1E|nr:HAD-IB family phosphatase [Qipengyuania vesicularis]MBX7526920.1 HAD-IB family phosphatase [Qipengyuania vesicularis]
MKLAIYDLDKTLVRRATFTPFLAFAARRLSTWRLILLPIWVLMMIGYRIGLYDRTSLKTAGMKLMLGSASLEQLEKVGRQFANHHVATAGWMPGVVAMLEQDRARGREVIVATAAFEFYARAFAEKLGVVDVIATQWDGRSIPGGNCYGEEKRRRVEAWIGTETEAAEMRFVSDSFADAPMLELADEAIFVTTSASKKARAEALGWCVIDGEA